MDERDAAPFVGVTADGDWKRCNLMQFDAYLNRDSLKAENSAKRYAILYLATLIVLVPDDFLFLGAVAKSFFNSQVGDMLGDLRLVPAVLFYLLFAAGIVIFASSSTDATWPSALLYGALFGFFCYATFELTSMSLLKHWTWGVVALDMSWGTFVTALSSALGLAIADWIAPKVG
jgi:uncharacterized membrane protein